MDVQRAKEIVDSPKIINVMYRGTPVHIDTVFETTSYAKIHYEDGTVANAAVDELQES